MVTAMFYPSNRNYSSWSWSDNSIHDEVNPSQQKLLVGDSLSEKGQFIYSSPYRTNTRIPGILVNDGNTYGRYGSRMLYKCVPSDPCLPTFLVPYTSKTVEFSKHKVNQYVLFRFVEWDDKHPLGSLTETVGGVNDLEAFYQFQIHARMLHYSVQPLAKHVKKNLPVEIDTSAMEDRRTWPIIAIDPTACTDFDDALGVRNLENGNALVSVYIANVPLWLEALAAWDHLNEQTATIYLPTSKRSMLPAILSENLCSLRANEDKYVVAMDVEVDEVGVAAVRFASCMVRIERNFVYDEPELLENPTYQKLRKAANTIAKVTPYISVIEDSHHLVELLMVMMNHEVSKVLYANGRGIFRDVQVSASDVKVPSQSQDFMCIWRHTKGSYVTAEHHVGHEMIGLETYSQVTSPIRRSFDLVNMIEFADAYGIASRTAGMARFVERTFNSLEELNDVMKRIKRVQNDCALLDHCERRTSEDPLVAHTLDENDALYIPTLNTVVRYEPSGTPPPPYTEVRVRLYLFTDEATLWRKVRIQLLDP